MKEEMKELLKEMHEIANKAEECITYLQTSFIYNSPRPLKDCIEMVGLTRKAEPNLTKKTVELAKDLPEIRPYVSVPVHLLRIAENIERLVGLIDKKIKEDILFSDKAITEITFLLQRLVDIIRPASDMILARNVMLARYIQESEQGIVKRAMEYSTFHEERLIEGLCLPTASSLYINMLDAIKNIAWHAKEISVRLG